MTFFKQNSNILVSKTRLWVGVGPWVIQMQCPQYVEYDGIASSAREKETGVLQGSLLGPLLFILYIDGIHKVNANLEFISYAADTTITSAFHLLMVVTTASA